MTQRHIKINRPYQPGDVVKGSGGAIYGKEGSGIAYSSGCLVVTIEKGLMASLYGWRMTEVTPDSITINR